MTRLTHPDAEPLEPSVEIEMTLAFILIRLSDLEKSCAVFSSGDEDMLLEIEQLASAMRRRLS